LSVLAQKRGLSTYLSGPDQILPATDFRAWEPEAAVNIRRKDSGPQSLVPRSIPTMLRDTVEKIPNNIALGAKGKDGNRVTWTYSNYIEDVLMASKGFIALGLEPLHSVCILAGNNPEWVISNLAAVHARGFGTGIYQTNSANACQYVADHSRANIIVVDDEAQLQKILAIKHKLPKLKQIVQFKGNSQTEGVISWDHLMKLGKSESDVSLNARLKEMAANQCACLVYTSGTTGNPKGAMLSHDAIVLNSTIVPMEYYKWTFGEEKQVSYLPLSHVAGLAEMYWSIAAGASYYFADENALKGSLIENLKEFRPTRLLGMPRVWEKVEEGMRLAARNNTGLKRIIADWAKAQALKHHLALDAGTDQTTLQYKLAKKLVLSHVHKALGLDEHRGLLTGGAPTSDETIRYFYSLDLRIYNGYASTESSCGLQTTGQPALGMSKIGNVGKTLEGYMENKLFEVDAEGAGEICTRGRGIFMGYLYDREKTLQTIDDDGWYHTGDIGKQDSDGFFRIVGRAKEIIITSGGENIAPANIEDQIKLSLPTLLSNVMVVGEKRKFLTCLLTLKTEVDPVTMQPTDTLTEEVLEVLDQLNIPRVQTVQQLLSVEHAALEEYIEKGMEKANSNAISNAAKVQKWRILPREFSVSTGELSPSLKLKRFFVAQLYNHTIEEMY